MTLRSNIDTYWQMSRACASIGHMGITPRHLYRLGSPSFNTIQRRTHQNTTKDNKTQHSQEFSLGRGVYFQQLIRRAPWDSTLPVPCANWGSGENARGVAPHCSITPINTTIRRSFFLWALHFIAPGRHQTAQILQKSSIPRPTWRDKL